MRRDLSMDLLDICSKEKWMQLENDIRELSGLNAAVFDAEGVRLHPPPRWPNELCPEIAPLPDRGV